MSFGAVSSSVNALPVNATPVNSTRANLTPIDVALANASKYHLIIACPNLHNIFANTSILAAEDVDVATVTINHKGAKVTLTFGQLAEMAITLAKARANGLFPTSTQGPDNFEATAHDYFRLVGLNNVRRAYPREQWDQEDQITELIIRITREIRTRDKLAADQTEDERVKAHVANMMSGVSAEAKLYNIVHHAVVHSIKNGSSDEAATKAGQNMVELLNSIRGSINEMAGKGTHGVNDHNVEAVVEEVFTTIDFALSGQVKQMDGQINRVDGQINDMRGEIIHLNAIGQHVNAIDGHVHSLGNNISSFSTLLNSTNGNVVSLTTQVALLQTIVNMLPRLISDACDQQFRQVLETALVPVMQEFGVQLAAVYGQKESKTKRFLKKFKNLFK